MTKSFCIAVLLIVGLTSWLNADQQQTADAIRELVGRGAIIKRFEVREAETSGLLVRLKAEHLDVLGRVDPTIIEQLSRLPDLALEIRSLPLSDDGLKKLLERTQLIGLDLSGSKVTDRGFSTVVQAAAAQATKLRWLDVSFTKIGDDGLKSLTQWRELRHVSVLKCDVTDNGTERLRQRLPKCRIER